MYVVVAVLAIFTVMLSIVSMNIFSHTSAAASGDHW